MATAGPARAIVSGAKEAVGAIPGSVRRVAATGQRVGVILAFLPLSKLPTRKLGNKLRHNARIGRMNGQACTEDQHVEQPAIFEHFCDCYPESGVGVYAEAGWGLGDGLIADFRLRIAEGVRSRSRFWEGETGQASVHHA